MTGESRQERGWALIKSQLSRKIIGALLVSVIALVSLFIFTIEYRGYQEQERQLRLRQERLTEGQAILLAEQVSKHNDEGVFLTITGIIANPLIVGARIDYSADKAPLDIGETGDRTLSYAFDINTFDEDLGTINKLGTLTTYATSRELRELFQQRVVSLLLLMAALGFAVLVVTALTVYRFVGIPLRRITLAIDSVNSNRSQWINWHSEDEIGLVVDRLNYLHQRQRSKFENLEQALHESTRREVQRLKKLTSASSESILIYTNERVLDANQPMLDMLGRSRTEAVNADPYSLFDVDTLRELFLPLDAGRRHLKDTALRILPWHDEDASEPAQSPTEDPAHVEMYVDAIEYGTVSARVAIIRDISERKRSEAQIRHLAMHDGLTNLLNRTFFIELYGDALARANRSHNRLAVMYLDLDHFKKVNDTFGHAAGDELLKNIAEVITSNIRQSDFAGRLGGDEFAIVVESGIDQTFQPEELARRLLDGVERCRAESGLNIGFGVSIGIAVHDGKSTESATLLSQADLALYQAKTEGRNIYRLYSENLHDSHKRRTALNLRLQCAIRDDELELHFQPQARTRGREIHSFEALLRWNDPDYGQVSPEEVIHTAEREGFGWQLTRWIIHKACSTLADWPEQFAMAINLSPRELLHEHLLPTLQENLERYGISPSRLQLEFTEAAIISEEQHATDVMHELKAMGILLVLDDFGIGYSSISMLQRFPFDRVKIDQSFIRDIESDPQADIVASTVIDLGIRLDRDIVAEGVETEAQLELLRAKGCAWVQGYLIGEPISPTHMPSYLEKLQQRRAS